MDNAERELRRALKQLEKVKDHARRTGRAPAVFEPVHIPAKGEDVWTLEPVFRYIEQLKLLPREVLKARYRQVFEEEPPDTTREWLSEALGRQFQATYYLEKRGEIPAAVVQNNRDFERSYRPPFVPDADDRRTRENFHLDPNAKLRARGACPFERGPKWTAFNAVELSGKRGLTFRELSVLLEKLLKIEPDKAQIRAKRMFTKWVRRGWTEVIVA